MKYQLVLKTARTVKQDERDEAYNRGYEDGKAEYESELEEAQETVVEQKATIKSKNRKIAELEVELEVLNKQKSDARDVVTKRLANENVAAYLKAREELVTKRESKLAEREEKVATTEISTKDSQYKAGYADGVDEIGYFNGTIGIDMGYASDVESFARIADGSITAAKEMVTATRREPGVDRRIDFHSRSSYFVTPITRADTRAFRDAIQRLDYENAPNRKRRASVSPEFARELLNHPDFRYYAGYRDDRYRGYRYGNYIGELFGVPIFAVEGVHPEIIAE